MGGGRGKKQREGESRERGRESCGEGWKSKREGKRGAREKEYKKNETTAVISSQKEKKKKRKTI